MLSEENPHCQEISSNGHSSCPTLAFVSPNVQGQRILSRVPHLNPHVSSPTLTYPNDRCAS
eukprot:1741925-Rhodomonas_salina.1